MKKSIKCGITAAVVAVASYVAYQSYGSYGVQDNSLLMQNIEALASMNEVYDGGDNQPELFEIVSCGQHDQATTSDRSAWYRKAYKCQKPCMQFNSASQLIQWKKELVANKNMTQERKRYVMTTIFCTGAPSYFNLTEEGIQRGYCLNTEKY